MKTQKNKTSNLKANHAATKLLLDAGISKPPIIINDIIQHLKKSHKLSVIAWGLGEKTGGIQITRGDEIFIGYNKDHHPNRQRFTVAHEIGHFIMGHTNHNNNNYNFDDSNLEEIEANQFAAELLMPLKFIEKDFSNGIKDVKILAKNYKVSEEMAWRRMINSGLVDKL